MRNPIQLAKSSTLSTLVAFLCVSVLSGCNLMMPQSQEHSGWIELFDGETLSGWSQVNGDAPYTALNGAIRGTNVLDSPNSFLASQEVYADFVL